MTQLANRIVVDPAVSFGKPCVRGTRIAVVHVLEYLAGGTSEAELVEQFPSLERADVLACIAYATEAIRDEQ